MISNIFDFLIGFDTLNRNLLLFGISPDMLVSEMTAEAFVVFSFVICIFFTLFVLAILFVIFIFSKLIAFIIYKFIIGIPFVKRFEIWLLKRICGEERFDNLIDEYIKKREAEKEELM